MDDTRVSRPTYVHPVGMPLGVTFGIVLSATLQWIRDGGLAQGAAIGLIFGVAVFGPAFSRILSRRSSSSA